MNNQQRLLAFFFSLLGSSVAGFFGRFLGSEGTAIITGQNLVIFALLLLGFIFMFRRSVLRLKNTYGLRLVVLFYISFVFLISFFCSLTRVYVFDHDFTPLFPLILSVGAGQGLPLPSPSDPSSQSSWSGSWIERWMNPEVGSGSEATSQPTGVVEQAGPSQQGNINNQMARNEPVPRPFVPNESAESSLRGRILSLENQQSPFLFFDRGEYWRDVKLALDQATSQSQYNELVRWENGELQVREQKQECFYLFQQILVAFPDLKDRARYCYDQQEVFKDFIEEKLAELDTEDERLQKLEDISQDLRQQNPLSPCIQEILGL